MERLADRYTLLNRFDDYVGVDSEPSGYAGAKPAFLDEIEFIPVPEEASRVAGLQSGEYHYLEEIIPDQIAVLQDYPGVTIEILPPRSYGVVIMNTAAGILTDQTIRQAVQAAIEVESSGQATHGDGYFELGPGIMLPQTVWSSDVSAELYNQNNPEKARQLLEEAGYDGTPVRVLCTQEDLGDYNAAVVAQQQLEAAGFTIKLEVFDEATLDEHLEDDERWDITTNAIVFRPDPVLIAPIRELHLGRQVVLGREGRRRGAAADRVRFRGPLRGARGAAAALVRAGADGQAGQQLRRRRPVVPGEGTPGAHALRDRAGVHELLAGSGIGALPGARSGQVAAPRRDRRAVKIACLRMQPWRSRGGCRCLRTSSADCCSSSRCCSSSASSSSR